MKKLVLQLALLLMPVSVFGQTCTTATCTAATTSQTDVVAAWPASGNANATVTVNVPNGTSAFSAQSNLTFPSGVTNIILHGNTACTGSGDPALNNLSCTDNTIIQDSLSGSSGNILNVTVPTGKTLRITGFTWASGSRSVADHGSLDIFCTDDTTGNGQFRYDHNHSSGVSTFMTTNDCFGVADHNSFVEAGGNLNYLHVWNQSYNQGASSGEGDGSWHTATDYGTGKFFFIEANKIDNGTDDCTFGGRAVARFNTQINGASWQTHPTGSGGPDERGCRAYEIYQNNMSAASPGSPAFNGFFFSSGGAMVWKNTTLNYSNFTTIHSMRRENCTYPQSNTPNGWGYCGTSNNVSCNTPFTSPGSAWDQNTSSTTGYACIDQPGRGQGDLIIGVAPGWTNQTTGTIAWTHEVQDPVYAWANTKSCSGCGGNFWANYNSDALIANSDYYLDANESTGVPITFTGATGVGSGTLASRPSTCTVGVRYFATDQGSWNVSGNGAGSGLGYKCTSTNTWTQDYTPYTYPNPLESGGSCSVPYSTTFPGTENPLSESGCWSVPSAHGAGSLWGDVQKNGYAFGVSEPTTFGDPTALLTTGWGAVNEDITATVKVTTAPTICCHEAELRLMSNFVSSTSLNGYEINCSVVSGTTPYIQLVRWNGGNGNFTQLDQLTPARECRQGDVLEGTATVSGSTVTFTYKVNGVLQTFTNCGCTNPHDSSGSAILSGNPGVGFYDNQDSNWNFFGFSAFNASVPGGPPTVSTPVILPATGTYTSVQIANISTATGGASIVYTTDGSTPTVTALTCTITHGSIYVSPFPVSASKTIKAIGCLTSDNASSVASAAYVIDLPSTTTVFTGNEGSNSGSPTRDTYTNCSTSCVSGVWQPVNSGSISNGQLACTTAAQSSGVTNGCSSRSVVSSTITGTGTTPLSNGLGAGGTDSLASLSVTYAVASAGDCGSSTNYPSTLVPSILLPGAVANGRSVFSGTTASSNFNTSLLAPTKWAIPGGDAANYYIVAMCETVPTTTGSGVHDELDLNHTLSNDDYVGPGSHYNFSLAEWDYCPQGCSSWKKMNLVNGSGIVTPPFVAGHHLYMEWYYHRTLACSSSSGSNCYFYDSACITDVTAGTPQVCGNWQDATTGLTPGGIPVHKSGFTINEINLQHQIDYNCSSCTISSNSDFRNVVAYSLSGTMPAPPSISIILIQ